MSIGRTCAVQPSLLLCRRLHEVPQTVFSLPRRCVSSAECFPRRLLGAGGDFFRLAKGAVVVADQPFAWGMGWSRVERNLDARPATQRRGQADAGRVWAARVGKDAAGGEGDECGARAVEVAQILAAEQDTPPTFAGGLDDGLTVRGG